MRKIAVFCGSQAGNDLCYSEEARQLGALLAEKRVKVLFGGVSSGLMAALADGVRSRNGELIGIVHTGSNSQESPCLWLSELVEVKTVNERKAYMRNNSDAFILLPGGLGTFDEFLETLTKLYVNKEEKALGILNVNGYYDPLISFLNAMVTTGFVKGRLLSSLLIEPEAEALVERFSNFS